MSFLCNYGKSLVEKDQNKGQGFLEQRSIDTLCKSAYTPWILQSTDYRVIFFSQGWLNSAYYIWSHGSSWAELPFCSCRLLWVEQVSITWAGELDRKECWDVGGEGSLGNCSGEPLLLLCIYFKAQVGNQASVCWEIYKHAINRWAAGPKEFEG